MKAENLFSLPNPEKFKEQMLYWADRFSIFCLLDNRNYSFEKPAFEWMLGAAVKRSFSFSRQTSFSAFQQFIDEKPSFLFGHLGYNAGNKAYVSEKEKSIFGDGFFFEPEIIIRYTSAGLEIITGNKASSEKIFSEIQAVVRPEKFEKISADITVSETPEEYAATVHKLIDHIKRGDCYEINYCLNFKAQHVDPDIVRCFIQLSGLSPNPFSALYKLDDAYCICASPERFLKKSGDKITAQPIKGTTFRDHLNRENDLKEKQRLGTSEKERAENIMVVDLMRNDLSQFAKPKSVRVEELCGIYPFPQVFQMISTVSCIVENDESVAKILEACYPPASITGAPKKRVTELIEKYENFSRGLFSGSIGYITSENDFDFNVVIRSIFYSSSARQASFFAGSGITLYCDPEKEYEECMAKAGAILEVLGNN